MQLWMSPNIRAPERRRDARSLLGRASHAASEPTQPLKSRHHFRITQTESFKTQLVQGTQTLWAISLKGNLPAGGRWGFRKEIFFSFFFFFKASIQAWTASCKIHNNRPKILYERQEAGIARFSSDKDSASLWDADPSLHTPHSAPSSRRPVWNKSMTAAKNSNS